MAGMRGWVGIFAAELVARIQQDGEAHGRMPRSLHVTYRRIRPGKSETRSRTCALTGDMRRNAEALAHAALRILSREDMFPCTNLGLAATNFTEAARQGRHAITGFFAKAALGHDEGRKVKWCEDEVEGEDEGEADNEGHKGKWCEAEEEDEGEGEGEGEGETADLHAFKV
jgi:hypothetical protein